MGGVYSNEKLPKAPPICSKKQASSVEGVELINNFQNVDVLRFMVEIQLGLDIDLRGQE